MGDGDGSASDEIFVKDVNGKERPYWRKIIDKTHLPAPENSEGLDDEFCEIWRSDD